MIQPCISENGIIDLDLFAGAGGLAVGLQQAGFTPTNLYEIDKHSCDTLRHNMRSETPTLHGTVIEGDIRKVDWNTVKSQVRFMAAGAPCQPFSLAGNHLAEKDGRNLFPEVMRAVRELHPHAVLLENVGGLLREAFRPYFEYILRQLEAPSINPRPRELWQTHDERIRKQQRSLGYEPEYNVTWRLLEAADYGAPQNRKRVIIVATRIDLPIYRFPARTHSRDSLMRDQRTGTYWERHQLTKPDKLPGNGATYNTEDACLPWVTVRDALSGLPSASKAEADANMNHWLIPGAREYTGHAGSMLDWPSKTIKAGVHGVPGGENTYITDDGQLCYYTLREAARIQSFPDTHYFTGARIHVTRQIGNAVPCVLAKAVAVPLYDILSNAMPVEAII